MILKDTYGVIQSSRASGKFPSADTSLDYVSMSSRILPLTPPSQSTISEPIPIPPPKINPQISTPIIETPPPEINPQILTPIIEIPPPISTPTLATSVIETPLTSSLVLEQQSIPPPLSPPQLQTTPISPPPTISAPQPNNPNVTTPRTSPARSVSDEHISEGTPEGIFNFEPTITSPESSPIIQPSHPSVFGPDFNESRINLTIKYPKMPTQSSPDLGKVLNDFYYESKRRLEKAMISSHSSINPSTSDSTWEAYRSWMNSEISKMKDLEYTLAESKCYYEFVPLMELWKLRNSQLCLPAPKIKEASPEATEKEEAPETEIVQHIESAALEPSAHEPQDSAMEKAPN
ncbi:proline-rich receptor-like protein kinase PERK9 [Lathyrus oleraceus]|uniref:proline-rich receptor-like protein kinase PERK9 n=1 Tax=Pisum sativum TaxID=3888 RepID=UPI0021D30203|nr:proline-rich receptor-like protein kinase PERK9 [Pisum sativum]